MSLSPRVMLTPDVTATRLGFGCGGLMRLGSRSARERLLACAFESGIAHFDVARMYGLGQAEAELGRFVRARRSEVTIATKFGIEPRRSVSSLARLQGPVRTVLARWPALRGAVKRRGDALDAPRQYDARTARRSLEASLAQVGTEYFDILFVHGARHSDDVRVAELCEFAEEAKREGKIRSWGVSSEDTSGASLVNAFGREAVLQTRYDIFSSLGPAAGDGRPLILFGILASALSYLTGCIAADQRASKRFAELCEARATSLADYLLLDALYARENAVVLVSTTQPARVTRAAEVARTMNRTYLDEFRAALKDTRVLSL
jgi:D-threo-aldose 1-dehydrogenase